MSDPQDQRTLRITRSVYGGTVLRSTGLVRRGLDLLDRQRLEDPEIAELRKRANAGDATAQFDLAVAYTRSREHAEKIEAEWYRKAAEQGHPRAQYSLGEAYRAGRGVPVDYEQAALWFRKAADQGLADAQHALGLAYDEAEGVPRDDAQALYWHRKAADQGHAGGQFAIGGSLFMGAEAPNEQAIAWFRKAAEQGHTGAQNNLGVAYASGLGVRQNYIEAHKWFDLAATCESSDSERAWYAEHRDDLAKKMTPAELSEAQKQAREWLKAFGPHDQSL